MALSRTQFVRIFAASSLLLVLACQAPGTVESARPAEPFVPTLGLRPLAVRLAKGASQPFQAEINYPEGTNHLRQPVAWSVLEAGGGSIDGAGVYTAPAAAGTYHVQVKREDFPDVTATATVTVK